MSRTVLKCFLVLRIVILEIECAKANIQCPTGMEKVSTTGYDNVCYAVANTTKGTLSYEQAVSECMSIEQSAELVYFSDKNDMDAIREWFNAKGVATSGEAGYWTAYKRTVPAPLEADGTLNSTSAETRKNRTLYMVYDQFPITQDEMWRSDNQPGDKTDKRDEMCTAQSYPWDPAYAGLDDYPCEGYQLHYAVCMWVKIVQQNLYDN